jgi:hypothetical protein
MPIGATCSAVLSAACHGPYVENIATKELRWGVLVQTPALHRSAVFNESLEPSWHAPVSESFPVEVDENHAYNMHKQPEPYAPEREDRSFRHAAQDSDGRLQYTTTVNSRQRRADIDGMCCFATPELVERPRVNRRYI